MTNIYFKQRHNEGTGKPSEWYRVSLAACHVFLELKHGALWQLTLLQCNSETETYPTVPIALWTAG